MNESPTNHALKYSQGVNVKSIPVQADLSEGPASTTGALSGQVRWAMFSFSRTHRRTAHQYIKKKKEGEKSPKKNVTKTHKQKTVTEKRVCKPP